MASFAEGVLGGLRNSELLPPPLVTRDDSRRLAAGGIKSSVRASRGRMWCTPTVTK